MRANVVVMSYNRPTLLKETIDSVLNQTHDNTVIWLYDDASDFDIDKYVEEHWPGAPGIVVCRAEDISIAERIAPESTRWPENMNFLIEQMPDNEFVTYLCDDDILHPDWLRVISRALEESPSSHMVLGAMYYFQHGNDPFETGVRGFPAQIDTGDNQFIMWWHLGAFAYKTDCSRTCNVRWGDGLNGYAHSWDVSLCDSLKTVHPGYVYLPVPSVYRREHPNALSVRLGRVDDNGFYYKAGEELLPEHVAGYLE